MASSYSRAGDRMRDNESEIEWRVRSARAIQREGRERGGERDRGTERSGERKEKVSDGIE